MDTEIKASTPPNPPPEPEKEEPAEDSKNKPESPGPIDSVVSQKPAFPEITAPQPRLPSPSRNTYTSIDQALPVDSLPFSKQKSLFNPPSSSRSSPQPKPRTPNPSPPRPTTGEGNMLAAAAQQASSPDASGSRPLNVTDALSYLDAVKVQFQDKPDVYNHFLDIMKDFKSQVIDTPGVIERVSMLFHGNPRLIQGFNTFLPPGYRIDISSDPRDPNIITVTTPLGTTTQSSNAFGQIPRPPRDALGGLPPLGSSLHGPLPPLGSGTISRSITPHGYHMGQTQGAFDNMSTGIPSPGIQGPSTTAAASFLGGLSNQSKPAGEFNHAIQYLNKIKTRYADDPNTYKQFLEILQTYQKEQRHLHDSQVYVQVQSLFKDAPDLLGEFKDFLPTAIGAPPIPGMVGILPHPMGGGPEPHVAQWTPDASDKNKKAPLPSKRRKRPAERDVTPPPPPTRTASNRTKKAKHNHKPDGQSPPYSPYQTPMSPQHSQAHPHPASALPPAQASIGSYHQAMTEDFIFFDRVKKAPESRDTYEEFLKLSDMFSRDIIDMKTLMSMAPQFLGSGDLLSQFKELMHWDDRIGSKQHGPPGSIRTGPPEALSALPTDDGQGPSYRRLPDSEVRLACSGRDQLCRSVLNDEWVSHPTWASEEAGFLTHKKNSFEEALHKSEEERHEYHVHLDAMSRTLAIFEPLNARVEEMTQEERSQFRLHADFGGPSKSIYHRIIKKAYGREVGLEIIQALQDCPGVAVPVVLARLKQRDEEWRRAQREWSRTWREVDAKNFYKSLDHQGISFKSNDKKNITAKHFVADIESVKAEQARLRAQERKPRRSLAFQLEYSFHNTSVLHDSLKMVYSFLDHSQAQYSTEERRSIERFLRSFVPLLCMYPTAEFNAACGPLEGGHETETLTDGQRGDNASGGIEAADLRKKLLKTVQEKSTGKGSREANSLVGSPAGSLTPGSIHDQEQSGPLSSHEKPDDIWIRESLSSLPEETVNDIRPRKPFFANTTFYTLLRLLQLLYSRLLMCKEVGAKLAAQKHRHLLPNPVAVELGLDEPNGPSVVLLQAAEALGDQAEVEGANVLYMYLLDACEKVFDNELDQSTFEEHMRWFFGNKAFHVFTLDKVIIALIKQVQTVLGDNKCQELWTLLQRARSLDVLTNQDKIRYRREAERHVGADDLLYKIEWEQDRKTLGIQLVGNEESSVGEDDSDVGRWREYCDSYVMQHPTERVKGDIGTKPCFLRRNLPGDEPPPSITRNDISIRISLGTYKLFYEAGTEDCVCRTWEGERRERLEERAKRRHEERTKRCSRWL